MEAKEFKRFMLVKKDKDIYVLERKEDILGNEYCEEVLRLGNGVISDFLEEVLKAWNELTK